MFKPTFETKVLNYKKQILIEIYNQLTKSQQDCFDRILGCKPEKVPPQSIATAYDLCERTIWKNNKKE